MRWFSIVWLFTFFFGVSCMTLTAISFERFVAVRFPSIYTTFFSRKRILEYVIGIWTVKILLSALQWAKINQVRDTQLILWWISLFFLVGNSDWNTIHCATISLTTSSTTSGFSVLI